MEGLLVRRGQDRKPNQVGFVAVGLMDWLKEASQMHPQLMKELKLVNEGIAQRVVDDAKKNAAGQPPHGKNNTSGRSQAQVVVNGLRARRDRIPTIKLDAKRGFASKTRTNKQRTRGIQGPFLGRKIPKPGTVTMGDVFFGAEFGGRRRKTTQQFLRHRGRQGYFFWQAVRDNRSYIANAYEDAIKTVFKSLAPGAR
jgi:hypothetical protein